MTGNIRPMKILRASLVWTSLLAITIVYSVRASREVLTEVSTCTSTYNFVTTKASWSDARDACAMTGGHLLYLSPHAESQSMVEAGKTAGVPNSDYWIGADNVGVESWAWLDGTAFDVTDWGESGNIEDTDCLTIKLNNQFLKGEDCSKKKKYICEKDLTVATSTLQFTSIPATTELQTESKTDRVTTRPARSSRESTTTWSGSTDSQTTATLVPTDTASVTEQLEPTHVTNLETTSRLLSGESTSTAEPTPATPQPAGADSTTKPESTTDQSSSEATTVGTTSMAATNCRRRLGDYRLHTTGVTLPDHLALRTTNYTARSLLRCAGACLKDERCMWFVYFANGDCLLFPVNEVEDILIPKAFAALYSLQIG